MSHLIWGEEKPVGGVPGDKKIFTQTVGDMQRMLLWFMTIGDIMMQKPKDYAINEGHQA